MINQLQHNSFKSFYVHTQRTCFQYTVLKHIPTFQSNNLYVHVHVHGHKSAKLDVDFI